MRRITIFLILMILSAGNAFAQKQESAQMQSGKADDAAETADLIVAEAKKYLGRPWVWAANGPDSFDCTGLTKFIYAKFGYQLGRTVPGQMANGRPVEGDFHNLQKGDIIIWGNRADKSKPGHVGIFIAVDASGKFFTFIHTSCSRGVVVSRSNETYYKDRYLGARRILPDFVKAAK